jgi:hypothetical protein
MNRNRLLWIVVAVMALAVAIFIKPVCADEWEPGNWWLETDETSALVGDTLVVRVMSDLPEQVSVLEFYRMGVSFDPTLQYIDFLSVPSTYGCNTWTMVNDTGYLEWDLIILDGWYDDSDPAGCHDLFWEGHIGTIRLLVLGNGAADVWIHVNDALESNINYIFPTVAYHTQIDSTGARHCNDAPWAYATDPAEFGGPGDDIACVAQLNVGPPIRFVAGTITVDVSSLYYVPWSTVKQLYK